jgi:hypothetical protein
MYGDIYARRQSEPEPNQMDEPCPQSCFIDEEKGAFHVCSARHCAMIYEDWRLRPALQEAWAARWTRRRLINATEAHVE